LAAGYSSDLRKEYPIHNRVAFKTKKIEEEKFKKVLTNIGRWHIMYVRVNLLKGRGTKPRV